MKKRVMVAFNEDFINRFNKIISKLSAKYKNGSRFAAYVHDVVNKDLEKIEKYKD